VPAREAEGPDQIVQTADQEIAGRIRGIRGLRNGFYTETRVVETSILVAWLAERELERIARREARRPDTSPYELAIILVDARTGYTLETAPDVDEHVRMYCLLEQVISAGYEVAV
jgi:hypothetical protein